MKNLKLVLLAVLAFASGSVDCSEKMPECRMVEVKDWQYVPIRETTRMDYERSPLANEIAASKTTNKNIAQGATSAFANQRSELRERIERSSQPAPVNVPVAQEAQDEYAKDRAWADKAVAEIEQIISDMKKTPGVPSLEIEFAQGAPLVYCSDYQYEPYNRIMERACANGLHALRKRWAQLSYLNKNK